MQYMLLIYGDEAEMARRPEAEARAVTAEYMAFTGDIRDSGNLVDGARLQTTGSATSVRVRDGETLVTDGPFAETKEQLGGFYLIEADDVDDAIAIAARIPGARHGTIEVRPIAPMPAEVAA
jgi:hypothetical protein